MAVTIHDYHGDSPGFATHSPPVLDALYLSNIQQYIGTWQNAGGKVQRGEERATLTQNAAAQNGSSPTGCFSGLGLDLKKN